MIRFLDILFSIIGLIITLPLILFLAVWIKIDSKGPVFFQQKRVGMGNIEFVLYKFRTMFLNSDKEGLITTSTRDSRVTPSGYFIRKYKFDELPQLINVLVGDMSLVGPRPEVRKYVDMYNQEQMIILSIKPGITDFASIEFSNENEILSKEQYPEQYYIDVILPEKIRLNQIYLQNRTTFMYFKIIIKTIIKVFK